MESQHFEGDLSAHTVPNEESPQAPKTSGQGGWISFPFITGLSFSLFGIVI